MVVAIFKLLLKNNLVGHKTKLVGPVPHLGYATAEKTVEISVVNYMHKIIFTCDFHSSYRAKYSITYIATYFF